MGYVLPRETGVENIHRSKGEKRQKVHESWGQRIDSMLVLGEKNVSVRGIFPASPSLKKRHSFFYKILSSLQIACIN